MNHIEILMLTTALAGVAGIGLGGVLGTLFRRDSNQTVSLLLSFAGGVMLSVVCFDLIQEGLETGIPAVIVMGALIFGVVVVHLLHCMMDRKTMLQRRSEEAESRFSLLVAGVVMASAIALHNVPEGMSIGVMYASSGGVLDNGVLMMAVLIGLHNLPAGMAISVPLISGGMSKWKAVAVTTASGIPTIIGALLGYWLGDIGEMGLALSLGFASGAMLYVIFGEMISQSIRMCKNKLPTFCIIIGMAVGLLVIHHH